MADSGSASQVENALAYALDRLVRERPAAPISFVAAKIREWQPGMDHNGNFSMGEGEVLAAAPSMDDVEVPQDPVVTEIFRIIDKNGSGTLSRAEVILACRREPRVAELLGIISLTQESERDVFESIFQGMDTDNDRAITLNELQTYFAAPEVRKAIAAAAALKDGPPLLLTAE